MGSISSHGLLKGGEAGEEIKVIMSERLYLLLLPLKKEAGGHSPRLQGVKETNASPEFAEDMQTFQHLGFSPVRPG